MSQQLNFTYCTIMIVLAMIFILPGNIGAAQVIEVEYEVAQIEGVPFLQRQNSIKSLNKKQIEAINTAGKNYSKPEECTRHLQTFIDYFDNAAETAQSLIRLEKERANNQGRPIADLSPHVDNLIESVDAFRSRLEKSCNLKGLGRNLIR